MKHRVYELSDDFNYSLGNTINESKKLILSD